MEIGERNIRYRAIVKGMSITGYADLEQCQSRFSLFKFLINVSTFLISWIISDSFFG